ncbi:MAG: nucleotide exchange factor GrpE [bacterium]
MTGKKSSKEKEKTSLEEAGLPGPGILEPVEAVVPDDDAPEDEKNEEKPPEDPNGKIAELNDKYLRLFSEFDNYRKRTLKEKIELSKTASADVITSLLPVLDDFERAIKAYASSAESDVPIDEGIILIYNKFLNILTQKGLEQMKTIGEPFDTDFHEAITNIPAPTPDMKGKVMDEVEKGYLLNGKVIRYAKVVVGC